MGKIIKFPFRKGSVAAVIAGTIDELKKEVKKVTGEEPTSEEIKTAGPFRVYSKTKKESEQSSNESKS